MKLKRLLRCTWHDPSSWQNNLWHIIEWHHWVKWISFRLQLLQFLIWWRTSPFDEKICEKIKWIKLSVSRFNLRKLISVFTYNRLHGGSVCIEHGVKSSYNVNIITTIDVYPIYAGAWLNDWQITQANEHYSKKSLRINPPPPKKNKQINK